MRFDIPTERCKSGACPNCWERQGGYEGTVFCEYCLRQMQQAFREQAESVVEVR